MEIIWGLQEPPMPVYLFVGENTVDGRVSLWYEFDHNKLEPIPVFERALVGTLGNLILHAKEFKGKWAVKLDTVFQTPDQNYVVRAGVETNFVRSLILSLVQVEDFDKPLTLVLSPGDDGKVIFCAVHYTETNLKIKYEWDPEMRLLPIIQGLQKHLGVNVQKVSMLEDGEYVVDVIPPAEEVEEGEQADLPLGDEDEAAEREAIQAEAEEEKEEPVKEEKPEPKKRGRKAKA